MKIRFLAHFLSDYNCTNVRKPDQILFCGPGTAEFV